MKQNFYYRPLHDDQNGKGHLLRIWFDYADLHTKEKNLNFFYLKSKSNFTNGLSTQKTNFSYSANGGASNQNMYYNWEDIPEPIMAKIINRFKKDYDIVL